MDIFIEMIKVFITGGLICVIGQILIDKTKLTPARILVIFVTMGVILTFFKIYPPIVEFGKAGATVPISGFGYALRKRGYGGSRSNGIFRHICRWCKSLCGRYCSSNYLRLFSITIC